MTMNLHIQTTAPIAAQATSVSPLEPSGSSKTKLCKGKTRSKTDVYQTVTNSIIEALERGLSRGYVRGSVTARRRVFRQISVPARPTPG